MKLKINDARSAVTITLECQCLNSPFSVQSGFHVREKAERCVAVLCTNSDFSACLQEKERPTQRFGSRLLLAADMCLPVMLGYASLA